MAYYDAVTGRAAKLLGDDPREAQDLAWEFDPDASFGVLGDDSQVHSLASVLQDSGHSESLSHRHLYPLAVNSLKNQLKEVNACITACNELDVAPIMWAPYRRYLAEKLGAQSSQAATGRQSAAQQFFDIAFPAYAPTTVRAFARLRSDRRIAALRTEVVRASEVGEILEPRYPQRILEEVLSFEKSAGRMRRIAAWITTAIGTVPIPGLGLAANVVAEAVTTAVERKQRKAWHWFYLISDGRGAT